MVAGWLVYVMLATRTSNKKHSNFKNFTLASTKKVSWCNIPPLIENSWKKKAFLVRRPKDGDWIII